MKYESEQEEGVEELVEEKEEGEEGEVGRRGCVVAWRCRGVSCVIW